MQADLFNRFEAGDPALAERVAEAIERDGYAIITGVLDPTACRARIADIDRVESERQIPFGANDFEGTRTRRIFNLIAHGPAFWDLVLEARMLDVAEAVLGADFLLSGTTSMHIGAGETPQLLHADDGMISLPRPHPATLLTTLWALDDFTADNGATQLVPGSHRRPDMPKPGDEHDYSIAEMPAGSVLLLHGSTWHGGGESSEDSAGRHGLSIQWVAGWCRQQQNLMLGTPREIVERYPRRLQELIGYSIYKNVMGHVDRAHPLRLLGVEEGVDMVWDRLSRGAAEDDSGAGDSLEDGR